MREEELRLAMRVSEEVAAEVEQPRFYREKAGEVEASLRSFEADPMVRGCMEVVAERFDRFGHGLTHVRKVAVDAGALVLIEAAGQAAGELSDLVRLAHLAGTLHDVKRSEPDHARRGAEAAALILAGRGLKEWEIGAVETAIRNHEAFKDAEDIREPAVRLISDALYDADKFRWGPDNFTETVWSMVAPVDLPLAVLLESFLPTMGGIERIRSTFRTPTGREYGPDFIDRGLEIGMGIYNRLANGQMEG